MLAGLNTRFSVSGRIRSNSNPASLNPATNSATGASDTTADRSTPGLGIRRAGAATGSALVVSGALDGAARCSPSSPPHAATSPRATSTATRRITTL